MTATALFIGIQVLSLAVAALVTFEYLRICNDRATFFQKVGAPATQRRTRQFVLVALYFTIVLGAIALTSIVYLRSFA